MAANSICVVHLSVYWSFDVIDVTYTILRNWTFLSIFSKLHYVISLCRCFSHRQLFCIDSHHLPPSPISTHLPKKKTLRSVHKICKQFENLTLVLQKKRSMQISNKTKRPTILSADRDSISTNSVFRIFFFAHYYLVFFLPWKPLNGCACMPHAGYKTMACLKWDAQLNFNQIFGT